MAVIFPGRKETAKEEVVKKEVAKEEVVKEAEIKVNSKTETKKTSKPRKKKTTNSVKTAVRSSSQEPAKPYRSKDERGPEGPKGNDDSAFVTGLDRATEEDRLNLEFVHIAPESNSPVITPDNPEPVFNDNARAYKTRTAFNEEDPERNNNESEEN